MWLNGIALESLHKSIQLQNITESPPAVSTQTAENAKYDGLRLMARFTTQRTIKVDFIIRERAYGRRARVMDDILAWLGIGGMLEILNRPNQEIAVTVTTPPSLGSVREYMKACSILFTAYDPYWTDISPTKQMVTTVSGTQKKVLLQPPGTAEKTFLEFEMRNNSPGSAMNSAEIRCGDTAFLFSGLGLPVGKTLVVDYDKNGYLRMVADGVSYLHHRTRESADDLVLYQQKSNEITLLTSVAAGFTLTAKGRWL